MANLSKVVKTIVKETHIGTFSINKPVNLTSSTHLGGLTAPSNTSNRFFMSAMKNDTLFTKNYLAICLYFYVGNEKELHIQYRVSMQDSKGEKHHTKGLFKSVKYMF